MNTNFDEQDSTMEREERSSNNTRPSNNRNDASQYSEGFRPTPRAGARGTVEDFDSREGQPRRRRTRIGEQGARPVEYRQRSHNTRTSSYGAGGRSRFASDSSQSYGSNPYDHNERGAYGQQGDSRAYGQRRAYGEGRSQDEYPGTDRRQSGYRSNYQAGAASRFAESSAYPHKPLSPEERSYSNRGRQGAGGYQNDNRQRRSKGPNKGFDKNKNKNVLKKKKKPIIPIKYEEYVADPNEPIRLNKFLSNAGVASRREADILIESGAITVNGEVVTELGTRITRQDEVRYKNKKVEIQKKVYVLLNKPKNCVTTSDDPECRTTVMDIVRYACPERIYPVGRLDRNTTGVLLCTNDGDLAAKLTHPSFMKKKIYHVWLDKEVAMEDMQQIADGIELEDGEVHADALSYVTEEDRSQVGIEIHSGRNRIVRRIFEHLGYRVVKLDRVYFAGLTKKDLPRGRWRYLNEMEVINLRNGTFD